MADELSQTPAERARKGLKGVMVALQEPARAAGVAAAMGISESTASRIKNERLEEVLTFLAHLGFKCVPEAYKCLSPDAYAFLTSTHERVVREAPGLVWDVT